MAISTNRNPIIICKGKRITTLAELQENFDISKVCAYAKGGRLSQWLIAIGEEAVNEEIQGIDFSLPEEMLAEDLMVLLGLSEEQQLKVKSDIVSPKTIDQKSTNVKENECSATPCQKIENDPEQINFANLPPILRKVMEKKEFVMETIQSVLQDDCSPNEIKWDTDLPVEIGISNEQLFEIYQILNLVPCSYFYNYPLAMFLQVIRRDFPARYGHIEEYGLENFSKALAYLGKDAALLGFPEPPVLICGN